MSTTFGEELFNIGARLKDERERLGLSQEALGTRIGTTGRTIKKYEANETSIRATELLQMYGIGADVLYIFTGRRSQPVLPTADLSPRQRALLANHEAADEAGKRIIEGAAGLAAQSITKKGKCA